MERLERLVNLVVALLDTRRPLTREELRERVGGYSPDDEAFRRAFERDKDELRQMGVPIVTEPLDPLVPELGTGYRVPRDLYELPDPGLDDGELLALGLAASEVALRGSEPGAASKALWKLAAPAPRRGLAPAPTPVVDLPVDEALAVFFSAISERRVVRFSYHGSERYVDPYRLSYRQGRWYLSGFDRSRSAERLFRADRVAGPVVAVGPPGAFLRPSTAQSGPPPPWRLGDDEETTVELWVAPGQAGYVRSVAGDEALASVGPDGSAVFRLGVTNRAAFRSFVLGLLDHAEVLGPPEVRREVVSWLEAIAEDDEGALPQPRGAGSPREDALLQTRGAGPPSRGSSPERGARLSRASALERLARLLAVVPWIVARDGPLVSEVCERFGLSEKELIEDLNLLFLCGVYPFTPDALIEVDLDGGRVWVRFADWFRRPLRLSPPEALALVAAARAALQAARGELPGREALASALAKLELLVGAGGEEALEIELGTGEGDVLPVLQAAAAGRRRVLIDYYSFGRDQSGERVVQPWRVFSRDGHWYLLGWCEKAEARRLFRVDRARSAAIIDGGFELPADIGPISLYEPAEGDPTVVVDLAPGAHWVAEHYPAEAVEDLGGGTLRVKLRASSPAWLERLLLRAGRDAMVVSGAKGVAGAAARRVLAAYGS
jgi:predicted DNA-binding transcriptional regulator YafY